MDEHPRLVSPKPGETRTGQPFEIIFGAKRLWPTPNAQVIRNILDTLTQSRYLSGQWHPRNF